MKKYSALVSVARKTWTFVNLQLEVGGGRWGPKNSGIVKRYSDLKKKMNVASFLLGGDLSETIPEFCLGNIEKVVECRNVRTN